LVRAMRVVVHSVMRLRAYPIFNCLHYWQWLVFLLVVCWWHLCCYPWFYLY